MTIAGFKAQNHPQQTAVRGSRAYVDDRATDPVLFARLDERFGFSIDVAAAAHNAKCARYLTIADDGLACDWYGERVWCNPPYSDIRPWLEKAWFECDRAELIVMLLPANRTEQGWWQEFIEPYRDTGAHPLRIEFIAGRQRFVKHDADSIGPNERPPFGVCLAIWQ